MLTRRLLGIAAALSLACGTLIVTATPASACEGRGCDSGEPPPETGGGAITIRLSGSGVSGGGEVVEVPPDEFTVPPTCSYSQGQTGKELADSVRSGDYNRIDGGAHSPPDGWEDHADDTEGHWWWRGCSDAHWPGDSSSWIEYTEQWFATNPPLYIEPGDPPPPADLAPEVLAWYAYEHLEIPDPDVNWNPQIGDNSATVVNLPTWVWLEGSPVELDITAEAGPTNVTVRTWITTMNLSAPDAAPVECDGFGTAWAPDEPSDSCAIEFARSSASQPGNVTPLTVTTVWDATWSDNGADQGALDAQEMDSIIEIPVAEAQTRVTG